MLKSKVYFTKELTPEAVIKMYKALGTELTGRVAVKVHSGEAGNQNYLHPEFMRPMVEYVNGTIVECNTAYEGARNHTDKHIKLMADHGWTKYFDVDIMDAEGPDIEWPIPNGRVLKKNVLGKNILNYDSMLVLSHFKGHPMGGFGGALKQLSIGCASTAGKCLIHSGGKVDDQNIIWDNVPPQEVFCASMADAAESVCEHFKNKIAFGYKWQYQDDEYIKKDFTAKPVCKLDLKTGEILEVFPSGAAAAKAVNGDSSYISKVCRGIQKSSKGFGWCYLN